ncbi:MAG: ATP-binding protein, partial [Acidobacteriota bacterium]
MTILIGRAFGAALFGIEAIKVEVQAAQSKGIPRAAIVGQAGGEIREARDRLRVALQAQELWADESEAAVIVNLAPAAVRKAGTGLDLPICLAIAALRRRKLREGLKRLLAYAEVGLDGRLRPAHGTLSAAMMARRFGFAGILVPPPCAREAAEVDGLDVLAVRTLADVVKLVVGDRSVLAAWPPRASPALSPDLDLSEVKGQHGARRALEVAAAGAHNVLLIGPPGSGKTLLARRMPTILPPLTRDEALRVTRVHSAAGLVAAGAGLVTERPFRAPHHTV